MGSTVKRILSALGVVLVVLWAQPAWASFVQHTESTGTISSGGVTANFGSATTTGNCILVTVRFASAQTITALSAGGQNGTLVKSDVSHDPRVYVYIVENITGASGVSATVSWVAGTDGYAWIAADEYNNVPASSVVDTSYAQTDPGASDCLVTGVATNAAGETVFMVSSQNAFATMSAGTDFTLRDAAIASAGGVQDYVPTGTLSGYTAHFNSTSGGAYTSIVVTLKVSGGSPPASGPAPCGLRLLGVGCEIAQ